MLLQSIFLKIDFKTTGISYMFSTKPNTHKNQNQSHNSYNYNPRYFVQAMAVLLAIPLFFLCE